MALTRYNGTVPRKPLGTGELKAVAQAVAKSRRLRVPKPDARDAKNAREVAERVMLRRKHKQSGDYRGSA